MEELRSADSNLINIFLHRTLEAGLLNALLAEKGDALCAGQAL